MNTSRLFISDVFIQRWYIYILVHYPAYHVDSIAEIKSRKIEISNSCLVEKA